MLWYEHVIRTLNKLSFDTFLKTIGALMNALLYQMFFRKVLMGRGCLYASKIVTVVVSLYAAQRTWASFFPSVIKRKTFCIQTQVTAIKTCFESFGSTLSDIALSDEEVVFRFRFRFRTRMELNRTSSETDARLNVQKDSLKNKLIY